MSYRVEYPFYMFVTGLKKTEIQWLCFVNIRSIDLCKEKKYFGSEERFWKGNNTYVYPMPLWQYGIGRMPLQPDSYFIYVLYNNDIIGEAGSFRIYDPRYGETPTQQ